MQPLEHEKIHEKNSFTPILSENEDYFKKKFKEWKYDALFDFQRNILLLLTYFLG